MAMIATTTTAIIATYLFSEGNADARLATPADTDTATVSV